MAQRFKTPPIAGLRRLLLGLFVLGILVVTVLLVVRRADDPLSGRAPGAPSGLDEPGDITLVGEGFEFTQSEGERPIFHIRGESIKVRRAQVVMLEDVGLTLYDDQGRAYRVAAREASYDQSNQDATLNGDLRMTGPDDMLLLADGMRLANEGRQAQTVGPVELFWGGQVHATAERFIGRLAVDIFALAGNVIVSELAEGADDPSPGGAGGEADRDPLSVLRAASITFDRNMHHVRADQNVVLTRAADRLTADLISLFLSSDDRRLQVLRARGQVRARLLPSAPSSDQPRSTRAIRLAGGMLTVHMDEAGDDPIQLELNGEGTYPAELVSESPKSKAQAQGETLVEPPEDVLYADFVVAHFLPSGGQRVEALGSPRLIQTPAGDRQTVLREVTAQTLSARLAAGGGLERVTAGGGVDYRSADVRGRGDSLVYDAGTGKAELFGEPVRVVSERGELTAPHVVQERSADATATDLLWADGGTRSLLRPDSSAGVDGSPFGGGLFNGGGEPVRIESESAYWRDGVALFRGNARAWQGESLLLAGELRVSRQDDGAESLAASGPVRSVWVPQPATASSEPAVPVEITAESLEYGKPAGGEGGTLVYRGRVRSQQGKLSLACGELTVELGPDGEARRMRCERAVRLEDRASGQRARGELALYDLAVRRIEITGDPVVVTQGDGGQVEGRRAVYELDAGRARVVGGGAASPAESPEKLPEAGPEEPS